MVLVVNQNFYGFMVSFKSISINIQFVWSPRSLRNIFGVWFLYVVIAYSLIRAHILQCYRSMQYLATFLAISSRITHHFPITSRLFGFGLVISSAPYEMLSNRIIEPRHFNIVFIIPIFGYFWCRSFLCILSIHLQFAYYTGSGGKGFDRTRFIIL